MLLLGADAAGVCKGIMFAFFAAAFWVLAASTLAVVLPLLPIYTLLLQGCCLCFLSHRIGAATCCRWPLAFGLCGAGWFTVLMQWVERAHTRHNSHWTAWLDLGRGTWLAGLGHGRRFEGMSRTACPSLARCLCWDGFANIRACGIRAASRSCGWRLWALLDR